MEILIEIHTTIYNLGVEGEANQRVSLSYLMSTQHGLHVYKCSSISSFCKQILKKKTFQRMSIWHCLPIPAQLANVKEKPKSGCCPSLLPEESGTENNIATQEVFHFKYM